MIRALLVAAMIVVLSRCSLVAKQKELTLRLIGGPEPHTFSIATKKLLINNIEELIKSSNFDSINQPNFPSLVAVEKDWTDVCSPRCLEVEYAQPRLFNTIGGPVTLSAFRLSEWKVVARNGPRVIRLGKWSGALHLQILEDSNVETFFSNKSYNNQSNVFN